MLEKIIGFSINNKLIVFFFVITIVGFGLFSLTRIPIGAVPDITNNQVQVITTSRNLSTQDVEQFITYPVELEMANLPGVKEIRSISKFGLSVVTIVFEDRIGTYLPRQLIAEKIKAAAEKIPEGFGTPEMGPITTGLGEIYQYILDTRPGYDSVYSTMDLRTIQDWIVKRQLSGIKGVVEINTWGGYLKQYEIAVNPEVLRSLNLSMVEIFNALESNNSVAGGGYIEKTNESYFVRGEGLIKNLDDVGKIVIRNMNGVPLLIKDVATVQFGYANRFGAITGNGEGEKVLGQVMMLKDGNSKEVIKAVKKRVAEVQKSLPDGVYINAFLERSELIGKTTTTVAENLILGCLIVIFIVVLLLGNIRSGLIIASVIPLCLLFAISFMYIFGIDANLMSLGAIDFGIIIDGAVIIVEFIAMRITTERDIVAGAIDKNERQLLMDKITFDGASRMMNSAIFGQLIILVVFIPILSLSNVEGKMFRPMALTFSFALIGAMLLCFTYVPVVASLFLKPATENKRNISHRLMDLITRSYAPSIRWALNHQKSVLLMAIGLMGLAVLLYSTMGGEFIPTLDEGDYVIQPVLKTGTSLSKTIEINTQIERILKENFPEVDQVVSRIGAAEVPTDPMSMEESDIIIKLKPMDEWISAKSKDELAEKFKEKLSVIPGIEYEFTQPIEMRFNELITGVRADVAVKIFGEDLDVLYAKGMEVKDLISGVEGASDVTVEKVSGLPQMSVTYDRNRIAKYGLNVADLNNIVSTGFAGFTAGSVFEGEKRFDLVLRLSEDFRQDLDNLKNLYIDLPGGDHIPLQELATIEYTEGPAKISRDNTQRRIVVGINVRNRDLQSVVEDVQNLISSRLKLPPGYTISYGGQFENLQSASKRLKIAVPIALILILIMLHFAFQSLKDALMVYTAIPLSAVGGVFLLWIRGLPFSISAGVGFIALFGIAVLNGIVLIEYLKELEEQGIANIRERVLTGTQNRLRPVLVTAAAAALGFLPMAVSTSAGAEVQRPLATVVIGGLITSTLLTMIILPVLYCVLENRDRNFLRFMKKPFRAFMLVLILTGIPAGLTAQSRTLQLSEAIDLALTNNKELQSYRLKAEQSRRLKGEAFDIDPASLYYSYDANNFAENNVPLKVFGIQQSLSFPGVYSSQFKALRSQAELQRMIYEVHRKQLMKRVSQQYYQVAVLQKRLQYYHKLDSLFSFFRVAAERKHEVGETNYLESLTAQSKALQVKTKTMQTGEDLRTSLQQLNATIQSDSSYTVPDQEIQPLEVMSKDLAGHPGILMQDELQRLAGNKLRVEKNRLLPGIDLEYFMGTNEGEEAETYPGYQIGLTIPLWFGAQRSRVQAAKIEKEIAFSDALNYSISLKARQEELLTEIRKYGEAIQQYEMNGKKMANEINKYASMAYENGEIDVFQYVQSLENAAELELDYLDNLNNYNRMVLELNYLFL
ncbi:MAG: CusA/CzcA family heavy metal efflux RND transporter [Bacteroidales bacterium]|nr:CusA/CzcA family heavy metal efflux RND transporter [Bacteroidales bacterium]